MMIRRVTSGPAEGWLSLGLVLVMCVTMAWAIDDVAPVMGRGAFTDFLMWAAVGGVLSGFVGPKVGWGRWRTYLIGSIFGALLVPLMVGGILVQYGSPYEPFRSTAEAAANAFYDLVVYGGAFTQEYGHHLLVIGLIVWATSMFAAYATFGHRRPLNAAVLIGVVLVINMALTTNNQLGYLILYSLASLFLLIRFHALEEQAEWLRRRIGDPAAISGIYLRGGSLFIAITVAGSILLTQTASSAPLAGAWDGVSASVIEWSHSIAKFLPGGPNTKDLGVGEFGDETQIRGFWVGGDQVEATIQLQADAPTGLYWRAVTRDEFDLNSWKSNTSQETVRLSSEPVLDGSADVVTAEVATETITFTVTPAAYTGTAILSPLSPESVDQTTTERTIGDGHYFVGLRRQEGSGAYTVTAVVPVRDGRVEGGLEANRLRAAGRDYPKEIKDLYLPYPNEAMDSPEATDLLGELLAAAPEGAQSNPYDIAKTFETQFRRDDLFHYSSNVQDFPCAEERLSTVECFAKYKEGYCQYYATTMAIFLRAEGIPARIAEGYLPGHRIEHTGTETLTKQDRHDWVEVYFPGFSWVMFDPTGGGLGAALDPLPPGAPVASGSPRPSASGLSGSPGFQTRDPFGERPEGAGTVGGSGRGPGAGLMGAIAVLLATIVGALAFAVWRRGPRGPTSPERAYGTVTRLATRLGYGPRPSQTVYEYAGALSEVLPDSRPALEMVARAKVESSYGRTVLGSDRLQALREAERRLRVSLLRLLFRRGRRRF
jgi:Transglutaminase-like superfamily/TgpA N-terminal domain